MEKAGADASLFSKSSAYMLRPEYIQQPAVISFLAPVRTPLKAVYQKRFTTRKIVS